MLGDSYTVKNRNPQTAQFERSWRSPLMMRQWCNWFALHYSSHHLPSTLKLLACVKKSPVRIGQQVYFRLWTLISYMWSRILHPNSVILKLFGLIRIEEAVCVCYGFFGQTFYHFPYWANPAGGLELGKNLSKGNHSSWSSCSWLACFFCRSLAVGSKSGYKFFSLSSVDKLEQIYECSEYLFKIFF